MKKKKVDGVDGGGLEGGTRAEEDFRKRLKCDKIDSQMKKVGQKEKRGGVLGDYARRKEMEGNKEIS